MARAEVEKTQELLIQAKAASSRYVFEACKAAAGRCPLHE